MNSEKLKMIDLFAGTGAFSYAFIKTGLVDVVFANDISEDSKNIYDLNFSGHKLTIGDINKIDIKTIPNHDILCGGFPCQPFSIAGNKKGFEDERSNVFWTILKITDKHRPKYIILENVKNLTGHDKGNTFNVIKSELENRNYDINYKILNTSDFGIPQNRERIYIVCTDKSLKKSFKFEPICVKMSKETITNNASKIFEKNVSDKYYYTDNGKRIKDKQTVFEKIKSSVIKKDTYYQYRRYYVRENKNNVCPTLCANMGTGGHNVPLILDTKGPRKLTPRECFNLQGFPSEYKLPDLADSKLYKLAGNAVSVPVVEYIASLIVKN
jgi:DNA (cytosine-5)-methyltransferase 1